MGMEKEEEKMGRERKGRECREEQLIQKAV